MEVHEIDFDSQRFNEKKEEKEECKDCSSRYSEEKAERMEKIDLLIKDRDEKCYFCKQRKRDNQREKESENQDKIDYCYSATGNLLDDNLFKNTLINGLIVTIPIVLILKLIL